MDFEKMQNLFAQTRLGNYDDEVGWAAVSELRMDGSREIFEYAAGWCHAEEPLKRARAVAILCQLRRAQPPDTPHWPEWVFRDESYELITNMLTGEQSPLVLDSAICALGHLNNPQAIPIILGYQGHPDRDVRFAVAVALGSFPNDPRSISGLLKLTTDPCSEVRDWAVFGLGVQGDSDSPEIREALFRCLNDPNVDVREEAAVGLGKRHDLRVLPTLRAMLDGPKVRYRAGEAADALLELHPAPKDWTPADYKAALGAKFNLED